MQNRLTPLISRLTQDTVLEQWFSPMQTSLEKVRYPEKIFGTLSIIFPVAGLSTTTPIAQFFTRASAVTDAFR